MSFFDPSHLSNLAVIPRFALVLGIMVVVHELGHFIAAKLCGVRVEAFAIGFGKRLFGIVHNGTDYCVNLIPLGGYVKMTNEVPDGIVTTERQKVTTDPGDFQNHPRWQRALITVAGPIANFILAFVLMAGLYMADNEVPAYVTQPAVADYVSPNSPIGSTGMRSGDRIVYFDNQDNPTFGDVVERAGNADQNLQVPFSYEHNGQRVDSKLFVENKGRREDFDFEKLGFIPVEQNQPVEVRELPDRTMPAAIAGFQPRDKMVAIDDQHPHSVDALLAYLQDHGGKPSLVTVQRTGPDGKPATLNIAVTPFYGDGLHGKLWMLGFRPVLPPVTSVKEPFAKALELSWTDNLKNSKLIFDVLQRLLTRQVSVKSLSSPIGMGAQVNDAWDAGAFPLIATMAMISLNLGIFNLLPIPILDGGMLLFLSIESLIRRDLNQAVKERVYQVAFVCLVLFAAMVIFNDITRYLPLHLKS